MPFADIIRTMPMQKQNVPVAKKPERILVAQSFSW